MTFKYFRQNINDLCKYISPTALLLFIFIIGISFLSTTKLFGENKVEDFNATGIATSINGISFTLNNARGSDKTLGSTYLVDISSIQKIESTKYTQISISDIKEGDRLVVKGTLSGNTIFAKRIVSFSYVPTVAKTTEETPELSNTSSPTSTSITSSSTEISSSSTPSSSFSLVIESENASTTVSTSTENLISTNASTTPTTPEIASTSTPILEASSTPVISTTTEIVASSTQFYTPAPIPIVPIETPETSPPSTPPVDPAIIP